MIIKLLVSQKNTLLYFTFHQSSHVKKVQAQKMRHHTIVSHDFYKRGGKGGGK